MGDVPRPQEDAEKWRRALVKKIRQVEELLARRGRGEALNERQLEKVARESSLRSALAAAEAEGAGQQAARTVAEPASTPAATPAERGGTSARWTAPDRASHQLTCNHCGRPGHEARGCTFGLALGESFLFCPRSEPRPCLPRTFIVPLRRAAAAFDPAAPRAEGRVDVGLRCVSSALFRSQSLRQNTQVTLCFLGGHRAGPAAEAAAPRLVEVRGALLLCLLSMAVLTAGGLAMAGARRPRARAAAGRALPRAPAARGLGGGGRRRRRGGGTGGARRAGGRHAHGDGEGGGRGLVAQRHAWPQLAGRRRAGRGARRARGARGGGGGTGRGGGRCGGRPAAAAAAERYGRLHLGRGDGGAPAAAGRCGGGGRGRRGRRGGRQMAPLPPLR